MGKAISPLKKHWFVIFWYQSIKINFTNEKYKNHNNGEPLVPKVYSMLYTKKNDNKRIFLILKTELLPLARIIALCKKSGTYFFYFQGESLMEKCIF